MARPDQMVVYLISDHLIAAADVPPPRAPYPNMEFDRLPRAPADPDHIRPADQRESRASGPYGRQGQSFRLTFIVRTRHYRWSDLRFLGADGRLFAPYGISWRRSPSVDRRLPDLGHDLRIVCYRQDGAPRAR